MKYKVGTLLSLGLNRVVFGVDGKCHSCKGDDIFIITDVDELRKEYTVFCTRDFYSEFLDDTFEKTFRIIDV